MKFEISVKLFKMSSINSSRFVLIKHVMRFQNTEDYISKRISMFRKSKHYIIK